MGVTDPADVTVPREEEGVYAADEDTARSLSDDRLAMSLSGPPRMVSQQAGYSGAMLWYVWDMEAG